jgi:hypothetical protein
MLAQPLPHAPDWKLTARRQADIYFDGLAGTGSRPRSWRKVRTAQAPIRAPAERPH